MKTIEMPEWEKNMRLKIAIKTLEETIKKIEKRLHLLCLDANVDFI